LALTASAAASSRPPKVDCHVHAPRSQGGDHMKSTTKLTNLFRTGLVASALFTGAAHADDTAQIEEGINLCVEMREKIFECKEEFADAFVDHHNPPANQRTAMRAKAIEEITNDGSGPIEPRRKACAESARGGRPGADKMQALKQGLATCAATADCKARVACLMPLIRPLVGKGQTVKK
jgi:hypothetical protein